MASARSRYRYYSLVALFFFVAALGFYVKNEHNYVTSDGRRYYVYLPSVVIDGDLDFANQYRSHWGREFRLSLLTEKTELGYPKNKYPIGLALSLAPAFLLAHGITLVMHTATGSVTFAPDGYTVVYQLSTLAFVMLLGLASLILVDRLLIERFRLHPSSATAAVVTYWVGSNYSYYYFREPFMVHVVSAFWVTGVVFVAHAIDDRLDRRGLPGFAVALLSLATGMAIVCRPTNVFVLPFLLCLAYRVCRAGLASQAVRLVPAMLIGMVPILLQMVVWRMMTGHFLYYSYEEEGFYWSHPALWQSLFSTRHGLFTWSPVLLIAAVGAGWRIATRGVRGDAILACYLAAFVVVWYFNAAWSVWWFGASFGGRAYIELIGLFVIGLALAFEYARRASARARVILILAVCLTTVYNYLLIYLYGFSIISRVADPLG